MSDKIDSKCAILLVMDYQPWILAGLPDSDKLLTKMAAVIKDLRSKSIQIGYVRVAFTDEDYANMPAHNPRFKDMAEKRQLHHEAPEAQVHDAIAPQKGDIVVRKSRVGAFSTTDLDKQLKDRGINTLILAGISTSGVVLSTVRDASDKNYKIYVLADGSSDGDQELHDLLMGKVFPRQATVITTADLPGLLG